MKRILAFAVALILLLPLNADAVSTGASAAVLMDAESGRILYWQNGDERRLIASITKLMTALVAVEHLEDLRQSVTVQPEWVGAEGSSIYLQAGEEITPEELLYGMLLQSGNDAALAIACLVAGDEPSFAALMNEKAAELGMVNSSFVNASGLNAEGHYSTAYDMARLACACLEHEVVAEICATRSVTMGTRTFVNHNKLLWRVPGCVGMKTGYTEKAGRTLISAVRRDGRTLVCVTLNDRDDWNDHETLFEYGFSAFSREVLCARGERFSLLPVEGSLIPFVAVEAEAGVAYPLKAGESPTVEVVMQERVIAPAEAGACVGRAIWRLDGDVIGETRLVCAQSVAFDRSKPETLRERLRNLFH